MSPGSVTKWGLIKHSVFKSEPRTQEMAGEDDVVGCSLAPS